MRISSLWLVAIAVAALTLLSPLSAAVYLMLGAGGGSIPDGLDATPEVSPGAKITVTFSLTGATENIVAVAMEIIVDHTYLGDLSVILDAPGGAASVSVFSRTGALTSSAPGYDMQLNGAYIFDDTGTGDFWAAASANNGTLISDAPMYLASAAGGVAGGGAAQQMGAAFASLTPAQINGTWSLSFQDATLGNTGTVTGATLFILTGGFPRDPSRGDNSGCVTGSHSSGAALVILGGFLYAFRRRRRRA